MLTEQVITMTLEEQIEQLEDIAMNIGGEIYPDYSGRFMYGAKCYGIVCDDPIPCIEEAAEAGLRGARHDSMGLQYIVYWPDISETTE